MSEAPGSHRLDPVREAARVGLAPLPLAVGAYPDVVLPKIAGSSSRRSIARTLPLGGAPAAAREGKAQALPPPAPVTMSASTDGGTYNLYAYR